MPIFILKYLLFFITRILVWNRYIFIHLFDNFNYTYFPNFSNNITLKITLPLVLPSIPPPYVPVAYFYLFMNTCSGLSIPYHDCQEIKKETIKVTNIKFSLARFLPASFSYFTCNINSSGNCLRHLSTTPLHHAFNNSFQLYFRVHNTALYILHCKFLPTQQFPNILHGLPTALLLEDHD